MKLYLDSADVTQWQLPPGCPPVQGATTNPTLVMQAGLPVTLATYQTLLAQAGERGLPELMLQLPQADAAQAAHWAGTLAAAADAQGVRLTLKLPCHPDWQAALQAVQAQGVAVLLTGLSNPVQLLWAQSQNVQYLAPYLGRLQADGRDVWALVKACVALQPSGPQLLAASIKSPDVLARLIACGAHAATVRPDWLKTHCTDPLTLAAMAQFDADTAHSRAHASN